MSCAQFKERVGAYALGALDAEERAACDAHLVEAIAHEGCAEALAAAKRAAAMLDEALPLMPPPPALWNAISKSVEDRLPEPSRAAARPARRGALVPWVLAAAALLAVIWLSRDRQMSERSWVAAQAAAARDLDAEKKLRRSCESELEATRSDEKNRAAAMALLELPATRLVALAPQQGPFRGAAVVNLPQRSAYLLATGLVSQKDRDYELWVIRGDEKLPAGLLHAGADGRTIASIDPTLLEKGADAFAVTLEPAGGGPAPRGPILLVGALPKT